jgi:hypothetical protein
MVTVRAVPRFCYLYPSICLITEEKHGKTSVRLENLSQVRKTSFRLEKPESG